MFWFIGWMVAISVVVIKNLIRIGNLEQPYPNKQELEKMNIYEGND